MNRKVLVDSINRIYAENKSMLNGLPADKRFLIRGFLDTFLRTVQAAEDEEVEEYAAFTHYFVELIQSGEEVDIPPEIQALAKKRFGVDVDAKALQSAFSKLAKSPEVMRILDELVAAFDSAEAD